MSETFRSCQHDDKELLDTADDFLFKPKDLNRSSELNRPYINGLTLTLNSRKTLLRSA